MKNQFFFEIKKEIENFCRIIIVGGIYERTKRNKNRKSYI